MFEDLNYTGKALKVLSARSTEELLSQIQSISLPVKIVSIYGDSNRHWAWILTQAKIVKSKKDKTENG